MVTRYIAIVSLSAALACAGTYKIQENRIDTIRLGYKLEKEKLISDSLARDLENANKLVKARDENILRETIIRREVIDTNDILERLRITSNAKINKLQNANKQAAIDAATAYDELFQDCARRYGDMAAITDRHVNDLRTCLNSSNSN